MKRAFKNLWFGLMVSTLTYSFSCGQTNLVPNPSFEQYSSCPDNQGQVTYATGWYEWFSADYFNACDTSISDFSVPYNWGGFQVPSSGNAYCGFGLYQNYMGGFNLREFIGIQLSSPLSAGNKYFVSLRVSLALNDYIKENCAINNIGARFFTSIPSNPPLDNSAHIFTNTIISDTSEWTTIQGSFFADSTYQYILLGNFFNDTNTDTLKLNDSSYCNAYYYLDDVCVSMDSLTCIGPSGIKNNSESMLFSIFPNPVKEELSILYSESVPCPLYIYNALGEICYTEEIYKGLTKIDFKVFPAGYYTLKSQIKNCIVTKKVIKY